MIVIKDLHKSFGEQQVLRGVDITIEDGETVAIVGTSGCGKSVLLKHLIGLLKPDSGTVVVDNVDMSNATEQEMYRVRERIGFLFQSAALFDSMSVAENITLGLREHGKRDLAELAATVRRMLDLVGLGAIEQKKPSELSGGMRKRVGLARALAMDPKYVFYDEPTTGLDPVTSDQIDELIADLTAKLNVTSLIVTHDLFTVEKIARRVIFLERGRVYFDDTYAAMQQSKDPVVVSFLERYHGARSFI
jgi:phospholipid/cholesterol/gamma-HCH transport system ATP-binding protein